MELRHLRYFVAVAEAQNVTRASAKLHVSQPALSRQIRDLEEELGVALLERSAKAVRLTEAGRLFLLEARAVLLRAGQAVAAVRALGEGASGEIHVGYAPSLTVEILPRALRRFQAEFPRVRVSLHDLATEEMLARLRDGRLQVALGVEPKRNKLNGLHFDELARYPMQIAVAPGHRLVRSRELSREKLLKEGLIVYSRAEYPEYHHELESFFAPAAPPIAEEHDSVTSLIASVEAGRGVALVPSCLGCMAGPRLKFLKLKDARPPLVVGAIRRAGTAALVVRKFIAAGSATAQADSVA